MCKQCVDKGINIHIKFTDHLKVYLEDINHLEKLNARLAVLEQPISDVPLGDYVDDKDTCCLAELYTVQEEYDRTLKGVHMFRREYYEKTIEHMKQSILQLEEKVKELKEIEKKHILHVLSPDNYHYKI